MNGNFVADAFLRQDLYLMDLSDPLNGLSHQSHTATGVSVGGSMAYRIVLPASWYIEPSGGGSYSLVRVGRVDTPGLNFLPGNIANVGTVQVDDIESLLGRLSLRAGFTTKLGSTVLSPFAIGTIFHEFASNVTSTSRVGGPATYADPVCISTGLVPLSPQ